MKTNAILTLAAGCTLLLGACGGNAEKTTTETKDSVVMAPRMPVAIGKVSPSPEYANASLNIGSVKAEKVGKDSAKVSFAFDVKNYELKMQTADGGTKQCNNSDKGQHIHFILDNSPYKALYEPKNEVTLANNTEHYLMAFLSRSYHESVKSKGAAVVYHFKIDEKGNLKKLEDPKTPMVFYSRPKGDYLGKDTANLLLDFYVWNTALAADGNKVKAHISNPATGVDTTITVSTWEPSFIQNLGTGKGKVELTLVDKDGKQVAGDNTSVAREFNMAAQEPMK